MPLSKIREGRHFKEPTASRIKSLKGVNNPINQKSHFQRKRVAPYPVESRLLSFGVDLVTNGRGGWAGGYTIGLFGGKKFDDPRKKGELTRSPSRKKARMNKF